MSATLKYAPMSLNSPRCDDAHLWARQSETRADKRLASNGKAVALLQTIINLIDRHIADMCEVGKPQRRSNTPGRLPSELTSS